MRLWITLALLWIHLVAGCASAPRAVVQTAPAVDRAIATSPTTTADLQVEARFADARSAIAELDPCTDGLWPLSPTLSGVYAGKLSLADSRKAIGGWLADERHPQSRVLAHAGARTFFSTQRAYISDVRFTMSGAEPVIGVVTTGAALTATAISHAGAGASIEAEVEVAWLYEPLGATKIRIEDPQFYGTIDVPAVLTKHFPAHFDLAPGEVGVVLVERSGRDENGLLLKPGVLWLTARPPGP